MKHLLYCAILGIIMASCAEEVIPPVEQPIEYQVRLEVECDSCYAHYAVSGEGTINGILVQGSWSLDTVIYSDGNCAVVGIVNESPSYNDTITARIIVDSVVVADSTDNGTTDVDLLLVSLDYYFE